MPPATTVDPNLGLSYIVPSNDTVYKLERFFGVNTISWSLEAQTMSIQLPHA